MPSWFPEGDATLPTDAEIRSLAKWCSRIIAVTGNKPSPFPEGCIPMPFDNDLRLYQKIVILGGS